MQQDIEYIKIHQAENKREADMKHEELLRVIKEICDGKAEKWVEKVLVWVGGVIGLALLGALMSLILIK